jgi:hypothetical protein
MSQRAVHCPFLNRSDARCSSHFSLDHLSDAFEQCMDAYQACPVYLELLAERRQRRGEPPIDARRPGERSRNSDGVTFVPLTLGRRTAHHA